MTFSDLSDYLYGIFQKKNAAYGNSAHDSFVEWGDVSYLVRIGDKLNRLDTLNKNSDLDQFGESILDTIGDGVTYLLMYYSDLMLVAMPDWTFEEHIHVSFNLLKDPECRHNSESILQLVKCPDNAKDMLKFIHNEQAILDRATFVFGFAVRMAQTYIDMCEQINKEEAIHNGQSDQTA